MRIISGIHKGKIIRVPANLPARPTTDYAKTGLFNMLGHRVDFTHCDVLDLFAGSGNISYEFVSRGCRSVTSVDRNTACVKFIAGKFSELETTCAHAKRAEVFRFLSGCKQSFDIIFADPPFDFSGYEEMIPLVFEKKMLNENGLMVIEHQSKKHFTAHKYFEEERKFGNIIFSFFRQK